MAFNWFKKKKKKQEDDTLQEVPGEASTREAQTETLPHDAAEAEFELPDEPEDETAASADPPSVKPVDIPPDTPAEQAPEPSRAETVPPEPDAALPDKEITYETEAPGIQEQAAEPPIKKSTGFFARLKKGLTKTREILNTNIEDLFVSGRGIDDNMLEDLEEILITSDIGVQTSMEIIERISKKSAGIQSSKELKAALKAEFLSLLPENPPVDAAAAARPHIVMVVGVNGVGKTTTIGKLAAKLSAEHKKGLVVAADTFRAAAVEQLSIWAERARVGIVKHKENADPAAVAFDGVAAAMARDVDTVYIDTAGRLHTKTNLMEELKKIKRSIDKKLPGAPHEILLVLDATTGQNALSQAKLFNEALDLTGIILTKLDGTAKGGIVLGICSALDIPLKYVGVGESIEDLQTFDPIEFVNALI